MKDIRRFVGSCVVIYLLIILLGFLFSGLLFSDNQVLHYASLAFLVFLVIILGFFEGGSRGESDSSFERRIKSRFQERGIEPSSDEIQRYYRPSKGAIAGFVSVSPILLLAIYILIAPILSLPIDLPTVIIRFLLFPYLSIMPVDTGITWLYLPLALIYPISVTVGYLMGPKRFSKILQVIQKNDAKRCKRNKRKTAY